MSETEVSRVLTEKDNKKSQNRKNQEEKITVKKLSQFERQRISSEMHDDIGAGLSGIRLMTEMAKMKSKDDESVSEIEKIYNSVGDISSKMKEFKTAQA